jgi:chromosome segregation ATPase
MATYDTNDDVHDPDRELQDPYKDPKRPYSIDLALELEHQLGSDSVPTRSHRESLDPHILASIVMQLRHDLAELTKERDTLQHMLSSSTSQTADLKDTIQLMAEKCEKMAHELEQARAQNNDDANAIAMLRSKVEESRYALSTSNSP